MKKYFIALLFFPYVLHAKVLDDTFDLSQLEGVKLGYYVGSFDPIHLGHQHVIEKALQNVDYLLVYPVPGGDSFKNRSPVALRQNMIASVYKDHPKVLITTWTPKKLQDAISSALPKLDVVGIIGSDVVTESLVSQDEEKNKKYLSIFMRGIALKESHYEDTFGALMALRADSFLVAIRNGEDFSYLMGKIGDRPICGFIPSTDHSSTQVRNAILNKQPFEHLVSSSVRQYIEQQGLYTAVK